MCNLVVLFVTAARSPVCCAFWQLSPYSLASAAYCLSSSAASSASAARSWVLES